MEGERLGAYRLLGELGSGGMGRVFRAEVAEEAAGLHPGRRVAVKVVHPHLLESPSFFQRFQLEARVGQAVSHENVVRCLDCDTATHGGADQQFLVMEYVEGQTLRDLLDELERVPEELCRHIGRAVANGLAAIHEVGAVHRDIKPENVLITPDHVVKVMDLGMARVLDEVVRLSQTGAFVGSLEYAAPEQFRGGGAEVDARTDLHALGILLYELATAQHPFRADEVHRVIRGILDRTPRRAGEVNPQLSPFFEEMLCTLLAKDRDERFASAGEVATVLAEGEDGAWWRDRVRAIRAATRRPLRPIRIPRETVVYGRDDDLARLRLRYGAARAGEGQVVLLEGEAGIGKTRLVDELVARLQQDGEDVNFLFGSYPPGGAATAAGAFSTAYREHLGSEDLETTLDHHLRTTPSLVPAFAALLRGDAPPVDAPHLTADALQAVFVNTTRSLAAERPTIVLIDDLHFAPDDGRALFSALAFAVASHPVLLLGTMRPGVSQEWIAELERLEHTEKSVLGRLGAKDLARLLEDAFHSKRLADRLGMKIARSSDGNPFFVFEIIRGLKEGQLLRQRPDGTWGTTQIIEDIEIPPSVLDLVRARVADLDTADRDLLDLAACWGYEFDPVLIAEVAGLERIPMFKQLAQIERAHRLVRSAGRRFVFDHHQVQEALYESLPEVLREEYHGALAAALERRTGVGDLEPAKIDGALCVDLCEHYLRGDLGTKALRYLDPALRHLELGYQNEQAIRLADRAMAIPDLVCGVERARLLLRKAERLDVLGRRDEHILATAEAIELAHANEAFAVEVEARSARAGSYLRMAQLTAARADLERGSGLAEAIGDQAGQSGATVTLGIVDEMEGRIAEARAGYERALELARQAGHATFEIYAHGNLGNLVRVEGKPEVAQVHYQAAYDVSVNAGDRVNQARMTSCLGDVFHQQERHEAALEHYERALALDREIGFRPNEAVTMVNMGNLLTLLGDLDRATEMLLESRELFREIQSPAQETYAEHGLGVAADLAGRVEDARHHYEAAHERRRALGMPDALESLLALASLQARAGETMSARTLLAESEREAAEVGNTGYVVAARTYVAQSCGGDIQAAVDTFEENKEALGISVRMEQQYILWKLTGEAERLAEAKELLARVTGRMPETYRQKASETIPLHRDILAARR